MSALSIYDQSGELIQHAIQDIQNIVIILRDEGVCFERWDIQSQPLETHSQSDILMSYASLIRQIQGKHAFKDTTLMRFNEAVNSDSFHHHKMVGGCRNEDEAWLFVQGKGLIYLNLNNKVYSVLCEPGDFVSIPAGTEHWMGVDHRVKLNYLRFVNEIQVNNDAELERIVNTDLPNFDRYIASLWSC